MRTALDARARRARIKTMLRAAEVTIVVTLLVVGLLLILTECGPAANPPGTPRPLPTPAPSWH